MCVGIQKPPPTALFYNCGFARVSIRELSSEDPTTCQSEFRNQFSECSKYGLSEEQFNDRGKNRSKFEYARQAILKAFTKKWYPQEMKQTYITTFSRASWKALPKGDKQKHTLSFCQECREKHYHLQKAFPCLPFFSLPSTTTTTVAPNERELTSAVLRDLNGTYIQQFGHTFVDSLVKNCKVWTRRKQKQRKKESAKKCRDKVNKQLAENVALHTLAEDESLARYQRKRLAQSFEKPPAPKKPKSHSPSSINISVAKENVLHDLRQFPDNTKINWSEFARSHGVTNKNGGQIIKEIALDEGIDVLKLECRSETPNRRIRSRKRKLPGKHAHTMCACTHTSSLTLSLSYSLPFNALYGRAISQSCSLKYYNNKSITL